MGSEGVRKLGNAPCLLSFFSWLVFVFSLEWLVSLVDAVAALQCCLVTTYCCGADR